MGFGILEMSVLGYQRIMEETWELPVCLGFRSFSKQRYPVADGANLAPPRQDPNNRPNDTQIPKIWVQQVGARFHSSTVLSMDHNKRLPCSWLAGNDGMDPMSTPM